MTREEIEKDIEWEFGNSCGIWYPFRDIIDNYTDKEIYDVMIKWAKKHGANFDNKISHYPYSIPPSLNSNEIFMEWFNTKVNDGIFHRSEVITKEKLLNVLGCDLNLEEHLWLKINHIIDECEYYSFLYDW